MKPVVFYGIVAALAVALDQWIKVLIEANLVMHDKIDLLPFLALYRTYNTGIAFSMFSNISDTGLTLLTTAVVAFVVFLAIKTTPSQTISRFGFSMIVGGALDNLIDRTVYGHVIDYILFYTPVWSFAIFNLADVFISVGAMLLVLDECIARRHGCAENTKTND